MGVVVSGLVTFSPTTTGGRNCARVRTLTVDLGRRVVCRHVS